MAQRTSFIPGANLAGRLVSKYETNRRLRIRVRKAIAVGTLSLLLIWFLFPFVWTLKTSMQTRPVALAYPPIFLGFELQIAENYGKVIFETPFLKFMRNGILTAALATVLAMIIGVPHAYALSKYDYKLRGASMYLILMVRVFPLVSLAVPFFLLFSQFGLKDTIVGVTIILTMLYEPFIVWIVKSYFDGITGSMIEAARVDGCTKAQAFYRVMLPMAGPALASATIFTWLSGFNHFTLIFFLTSSPDAQTIPFGILSLVQDNYVPWNIIAAASLLSMIPSFIIIVLFTDHLVEGITGRID